MKFEGTGIWDAIPEGKVISIDDNPNRCDSYCEENCLGQITTEKMEHCVRYLVEFGKLRIIKN